MAAYADIGIVDTFAYSQVHVYSPVYLSIKHCFIMALSRHNSCPGQHFPHIACILSHA